jgi:CMP-N,N'-diacetyllegionaminic acid synthase
MRILLLIPARGGSKRVPKKNMRHLGGKPLISWTLDISKGVPGVCDVLVSTDDLAIAQVGKSSGAKVPWLRPAELSSDTANSVDVALHGLDWFEGHYGKVDGLLLLQPTSPFRTREMLETGIRIFYENGRKSVIGISPTKTNPAWSLKIERDRLVPLISLEDLKKRSQDLITAYEPNGSFYLISPEELRSQKSFYGAESLPLIINSEIEALDIDTEQDFLFAEFIFQSKVK